MMSPDAIEKAAERAGEAKASLGLLPAFLLACLAGIFIGFGASFMLVVRTDTGLGFGGSSLLGGLSFTLGLFMILVAGAELFTGNNLMVIGMLSGKYPPKAMLSRWAVVYAGNLVGSLFIAVLVHLAGLRELAGGEVGQTILAVASAKASLDAGTVFFRGILCNMVVCLAVGMGYAAESVADKLAAIILPVSAFVACGYEHCVANMFFLPLGLLTQDVLGLSGYGLSEVLSNIAFATLGNIVGGAGIIACTYWFIYGRKKDQ